MEQFGLMMDRTNDATIIVGNDGLIKNVNAPVQLLFGYPQEELVGQSPEILIHERFQKAHPDYVRFYLSAPYVRPMGADLDLSGCLTKMAESFPSKST